MTDFVRLRQKQSRVEGEDVKRNEICARRKNVFLRIEQERRHHRNKVETTDREYRNYLSGTREGLRDGELESSAIWGKKSLSSIPIGAAILGG